MHENDSSPNALIEARALCKFYGTQEVLHEVSLAVHPREIVTIVGPNGAGKTTLLSCIMGLIPPSRGEIYRAPGLRIGYVPQHFRPHASLPMSASNFLTLYAPHALSKIAELAEELSIQDVLQRPLTALSGGELRRVLLLRALLRAPQLLVLDEPTQGVDVVGQAELYRLLKRMSDRLSLAVLMVSHDLYVVMGETDRVICLNHHVCCEGTPERVGEHPQFRALFGEELARALAIVHHHHDHTHGVHAEHFEHRHG